jgi:hypothetical protein
MLGRRGQVDDHRDVRIGQHVLVATEALCPGEGGAVPGVLGDDVGEPSDANLFGEPCETARVDREDAAASHDRHGDR